METAALGCFRLSRFIGLTPAGVHIGPARPLVILPTMPEVQEFVYYRTDDYARVIRRIPSMLVDLAVMLLVLGALVNIVQLFYVPRSILVMPRSPERNRQLAPYWRPIQQPTILACAALTAAYHIILRRTRGGTLGYRVLRIRLVDATGQPPPWKALVKRFLFAVPLFFFFAATYWACFQNPRRQSLHDTLANTWLVRKNAQPAGPARAAYQAKLLGPWLLTYVDVEPIENEPA